MNNTFFSFKRFWLLLRNDILINYKAYLFTIAGAFIAIFIVLYWNMPKQHVQTIVEDASGRRLVYSFGMDSYKQYFFYLMLGLVVFIGLAFSQFENKVKSVNYLLIPASNLEKFASQFLVRVVVGTSLFLLIFWIDANLARLSALFIFDGDSSFAIAPLHLSSIIKLNYGVIELLLILFFLLIAVLLFSTRLFFEKYAVLKQMLVAPLSIFGVLFLSVGFSHLFFPIKTHGFKINSKLSYQPFQFSGIDNIQVWFLSSMSILILLLIALGYYKLKEKQL